MTSMHPEWAVDIPPNWGDRWQWAPRRPRQAYDFSPTTQEKFFSKIAGDPGPFDCWPWLPTGIENGYGSFGGISAHRWSYYFFVGEHAADRLEFDHLCSRKRCVNPAHLEPVDGSVNCERAWIRLGPLPHHLFENQMRDAIRSGELRGALPPTKALMASFGVGYELINRVLPRMAAAGVLVHYKVGRRDRYYVPDATTAKPDAA